MADVVGQEWLERWIEFPDDGESMEEGGQQPIEESVPGIAIPSYVMELNERVES